MTRGSTNYFELIYRIFFPFSCVFFLTTLYRSVNIVLGQEISSDLEITHNELGFLTSIYFLTFAIFQIPLGILVDRFGPKNTQICLLLIASLGSFVFSVAGGVFTLTIGRALIGIGFSGGLMVGIIALIIWFPKKHISLVNGLFVGIGSLGGVFATVPTKNLLVYFNWREQFQIYGIITIFIALLLWLLYPKNKSLKRSNNTIFNIMLGVVNV